MNQHLAVLRLTGIAAIGVLSGCGAATIEADTSCGDYLAQAGDARRDAAIRLSSELGVHDAGNPMWAPSLDYSCGSNRDRTVGDVLKRTKQ